MTQETELIIKFNESVFWSLNIIILKLWKTKLEKRKFKYILCSCILFLHQDISYKSYLSKKTKELKSDCRFYE